MQWNKILILFKYLNGNKNVIMICTINPNISDMFDNKNVLHFASKAQKVKPIKSWIEQVKKVNSKFSKGIISKKVYKMYTTSKEYKNNKFKLKKKNKVGSKKENKDNLNSNGSSLNNSVVDSSSEFSEDESDNEISNTLAFSNENKMNTLKVNDDLFKNNNSKKDISSSNNVNNNEDNISDNEKINLLQKQKIIDYIEYREEYNNEINRYENNYEIYKNICLGFKNYDLGLPYKSKTYVLINPFNKIYKDDKKENYETIKETEFEIKGKEKSKIIFKKIKNYFSIESSKNNSNNNSICSENEFELISKVKKKKKQKNKLIEKSAFTDISDLSNYENNFESIPEKEEENIDETKKKISGIFKKKSFSNEIENEIESEEEYNKKENKKKGKTKKKCKKSKKKIISISDYGTDDENDVFYSDYDTLLNFNVKKKFKSKKSIKRDSNEYSNEKKNSIENEEEKKTKKRKGNKTKKRKN